MQRKLDLTIVATKKINQEPEFESPHQKREDSTEVLMSAVISGAGGERGNKMVNVHNNFLKAVNTYNSAVNPKIQIRNKKRTVKPLESKDRKVTARVYCWENSQ